MEQPLMQKSFFDLIYATRVQNSDNFIAQVSSGTLLNMY